MKRLSVFLVGLLSAVLVFSVVGLADMEDSVSSYLNINDVIDITIVNNTSDADIDQDADLDDWNDSSVGMKGFGSFTVQILTLTDYTVDIGYVADLGDATPSSLNNDPLYINSQTNHGGSMAGYISENSSLDNDFSNTNNIGSDGESQEYDLSVDPSLLTEDYIAGDQIIFTVNVTVSDNTTV